MNNLCTIRISRSVYNRLDKLMITHHTMQWSEIIERLLDNYDRPDRVYELHYDGWLSYRDKLYVPLEAFCARHGIDADAVMTDGVLDSLSKLKKL
jgi:hypothetical protein